MRNRQSNIVGNPEHERRKKQMRNRQSNIVGTPHERRKKQTKDRQAKLVGTPEHQRRNQKMKSQLANVVGTPEYEKHKTKVWFKKLQNANSASLKIDTFKQSNPQGTILNMCGL